MTAWQRVNTVTLNTPRPRTIRGVTVRVYFGDDDMPIGIRGNYDRTRKKFVIEFGYDAEPEETRRIQYDPNVSLMVGQLSDRLYEVEVDVDAMNVGRVLLELPKVEDVLDSLAKKAPEKGLNRLDNYVAASQAFRQVRPQLERQFAQ